MKQTKAPKLTPSPRKDNKSSAVAKEYNPSAVFISMALDMSWKLAIAVLVPVIIGAILDNHHKGHLYVFIGLGVALIGAIIVMYQSYKEANEFISNKGVSK